MRGIAARLGRAPSTVSREIAFAVGIEAQRQGHAPKTPPEELKRKIDESFWEPAY